MYINHMSPLRNLRTLARAPPRLAARMQSIYREAYDIGPAPPDA
jgi:hypothetical protein